MSRIGFISVHTSPTAQPGTQDAGGMNVTELAQAQALAELGYEVDLVTRRSDPTSPDIRELAPGLRLVQLPAGPARLLAKSEHEALIADFTAELGKLAPYRLLHSHHWFSGLAALPVSRARNIPLVATFHSIAAPPDTPLSAGERPETPGRLAGEKRIAAEADLLVAVSNAEADTIVHRLGADRSRVQVVYPGVDNELFRPAAASDQLPDFESEGGTSDPTVEPGYLLFAGRLEPLKGPDVAIAALAGLAQQPRLVIVGDAADEYDWYEAELRSLAQQLGISDNIRWLGSQPRVELAALLRHASALVVPSYSETFGLIALEAEASGTPVIGSKIPGLDEAVRDGETGILIPSREPEAWTAAIDRLLLAPKRRSELAANARQFALQRTWQASAAQLADWYEALDHGPVSDESRDAADVSDSSHPPEEPPTSPSDTGNEPA